MTEDDVFAFYRGKFQRIYSDLVALTSKKPTQVLIEIENAFTHLSSAKAHPDVADKNLASAKGHLMRAALDCSKIMWVHQSRVVRRFADDELLKKFCVNCPEDEFVHLLNAANQTAMEARRHEMENVGIDPEKSIDMYYKAASSMTDVIGKCDINKMHDFEKFRFAFWVKHHAVALIIGVIAGLISSLFI